MTDAGLSIVALWENGFPTTSDYFSYTRGVHDGVAAYHIALTEIRQPAGTPIYFTVDYDAAPADITGGISDYFHGVRDGFHTIGRGAPVYAIGVYGSGCVCAWLLDHAPSVTYAWLSLSAGWSGYDSFTRWNIKQSVAPDNTVRGLPADWDESLGHGGGFKVL